MRVVSLVPSLTEALAVTVPDVLVGATEWCSHVAGLELERFGGTKNPDVEGVARLRPDLVVVNTEENRAVDLDLMRAAGLELHVTDMETVPAALDQLEELLARLGASDVGWLSDARRSWSSSVPPVRASAVVPIWRRPWMHVGRDTFAGDVLRRLGVANVLSSSEERYPKVALEELPPYDLVVLPDEPYEFTADDGPEAFPGVRCALVSGRHLTWYGPSLAEALAVLEQQLFG